MRHVGRSRPDYGTVFKVKVLKTDFKCKVEVLQQLTILSCSPFAWKRYPISRALDGSLEGVGEVAPRGLFEESVPARGEGVGPHQTPWNIDFGINDLCHQTTRNIDFGICDLLMTYPARPYQTPYRRYVDFMTQSKVVAQ